MVPFHVQTRVFHPPLVAEDLALDVQPAEKKTARGSMTLAGEKEVAASIRPRRFGTRAGSPRATRPVLLCARF